MSRVSGSVKQDVSFSRYFPTLTRDKLVAGKYIVASLLAALVIGSLYFFAAKNGSSIIALAVDGGFIAMGLLHSFFWRKALPMSEPAPVVSAEGWRFTALLCLGMTGSLFILYYITDWADPALSLMAACLFLLPFTIIQSWFTYIAIPAGKYKIWYHPANPPDHTQKPGDILLRIRVARKYFDIDDIAFPMMARPRILLGTLFCYFISEQDKNGGPGIECVDEDHEPYGWEFHMPILAGFASRRLDPNLTLGQNRIKSNDSILVKRVRRKNSRSFI